MSRQRPVIIGYQAADGIPHVAQTTCNIKSRTSAHKAVPVVYIFPRLCPHSMHAFWKCPTMVVLSLGWVQIKKHLSSSRGNPEKMALETKQLFLSKHLLLKGTQLTCKLLPNRRLTAV